MFSCRDDLDQQLAEDVACILHQAAIDKGKAVLAVSGGKTPLGLFQVLSRKKLLWDRVWITLVDERWVDITSQDSNEKLVRENLLINEAQAARFSGLKTTAETATEGAEICNLRLAGLGKIDVVILGMGNDGHTASLFPGAENLDGALEPGAQAYAALTPPTAINERITMTLPRIVDSCQIYIHITGDEKKQVLEKALHNCDLSRLPVSAVLQQKQTPVRVYWSE